MFKNLVLQRPLAVLDVETTGTDTQQDRIIEIAIVRILPNGKRARVTRRINPEVPIPASATEVHGITDADVAGEPTFAEVASELLAFLDGCDLCGFNLKRFDLRMLHLEFGRAGLELPLTGRAILDVMEIFHTYEKRDLAAAVRFYCARDHEGAHAAGADVMATAEVLDAMLARYEDLPRTTDELHQYFRDPNAADSSGYFVRLEGRVQFTFGKHRGQPLDVVARPSPIIFGGCWNRTSSRIPSPLFDRRSRPVTDNRTANATQARGANEGTSLRWPVRLVNCAMTHGPFIVCLTPHRG